MVIPGLHFSKTDPRLTDYDTLLRNIHDLKAGKEVEIPIYDFKSSSRTGYRLSSFHFNVNVSNLYMGSFQYICYSRPMLAK